MSALDKINPQNIKVFILVSIGRASSVFIQGLFEGHPEVLTIAGTSFYLDKVSTKQSLKETSNKFYQKIERGITYNNKHYRFNESFPKEKFYKNLKRYIEFFGLNTKNLFLGVHYAFALHFNFNINNLKYILAHGHTSEFLFKILKDFPDSKIIYAVRDPRANYLSYKKKLEFIIKNPNCISKSVIVEKQLILNKKNYFPIFLNLKKKLLLIKFMGSIYKEYFFFNILKKRCELLVIKHEELHTNYPKIKREIIQFLSIKSDSALETSTFFNKPYNSSESMIPSTIKVKSSKPNKKFAHEQWKEELSSFELKLIQFIFFGMMKTFNYKKIKF